MQGYDCPICRANIVVERVGENVIFGLYKDLAPSSDEEKEEAIKKRAKISKKSRKKLKGASQEGSSFHYTFLPPLRQLDIIPIRRRPINRCPCCPFETFSMTNLRRHMMAVGHGRYARPRQSPELGEVARRLSYDDVDDMDRFYHDGAYYCPSCSESFQSAEDLRQHFRDSEGCDRDGSGQERETQSNDRE
jgi:hypothetical protein